MRLADTRFPCVFMGSALPMVGRTLRLAQSPEGHQTIVTATATPRTRIYYCVYNMLKVGHEIAHLGILSGGSSAGTCTEAAQHPGQCIAQHQASASQHTSLLFQSGKKPKHLLRSPWHTCANPIHNPTHHVPIACAKRLGGVQPAMARLRPALSASTPATSLALLA